MKKPTAVLAKTVCVLVFVSLCTGSVAAATIRGRLVHANGYAAAGVMVTVVNQQAGRSAPAYAGPDGIYYLYNVPPGSYYLEVWITPGGKPLVYPIQVVNPATDIAQIGIP